MSPAPDSTTTTWQAGRAGTVTVADDGAWLSVVDVATTGGWRAEIEQHQGREVEVVFRDGTTRIDLEAEYEDGRVRVRVRERSLDTSGSSDDDRRESEHELEPERESGHESERERD